LCIIFAGKIYRFIIFVFQEYASKNQDFFMTFSAPTSNFRTFQVLKNENSNFRTFEDFSGRVGTLSIVKFPNFSLTFQMME